jgi:hypothetical protein
VTFERTTSFPIQHFVIHADRLALSAMSFQVLDLAAKEGGSFQPIYKSVCSALDLWGTVS